MRKTLVATMLVVCSGCAPETDAAHGEEDIDEGQMAIVNGDVDNIHFAVGQVRIGTERCSGTLVSPQRVITAAHCVAGKAASNVKFALFGVFPVGGGVVNGTLFDVDVLTVHPGFVAPSTNDVALLHLTKPSSVAPLPLLTTAPSVGDAIKIVGFGVTSFGGTNSGVRRSADNEIETLHTGTFEFLTATGGTGNTCSGDSGGPSLRTKDTVEGVTGVHSTGKVNAGQPATCDLGGQDNRIDYHAAWILQQTKLEVATIGWANPRDPADVDGDGVVAPLDVLTIVNQLNTAGSHSLSAVRSSGEYFYDVNADGWIAPVDALLVINKINGL